MSRRYPLDPPPSTPDQDLGDRRGGPERPSLATRMAASAAQLLLDAGAWRRRHPDLSQAITGSTLLVLGLLLGSVAAITDSYLHRGVESGAEQPYIVQPTAKTLAANVDLRPWVNANLETVTETIAEGGFEYVRQVVSWAEVEETRGRFEWSAYDAMFEDLRRRQIGVIAVIVDTPPWARPIGTSRFENAPPRDPAMVAAFAEALASRYDDSVPFVQLWDAPNLAAQWGGEVASGADFAAQLEALWRGARTGNPGIRIVTPELAPATDVPGGFTDLAFVEALYDAGGARYFDVLGIVLDGGTYSPDDRRVDPERMNFSRAILFRELMVTRGDAGTPIWATSFGWAVDASISRQEQAEFVERGLERSWSEWPWMGLMVQWAFLANDATQDAPYAVVVLPGGQPTPLYAALTSSEIRARSHVANTGFMPMDFEGIDYSPGWRDQNLEGRTFRTTRQVGSSVTFTFQGTGLIAYVRSGPATGQFRVELDGNVVPGGGGPNGEDWDLSVFSSTNDFPRTLIDDVGDTRHTVTITLVGEGELTLGGLEVIRQAPFVWPIILMTVGSLISLFFGLRSIAYLFATRGGHLRRRQEFEPGPPLPYLHGWRPGRRVS